MKEEIFNFCPHKKSLKSYDGIITKNEANDRGIDFWKSYFQKSIPLSFASFFVMIPSYDFNDFLWGQKLNISSFIWATSEQNRSRELGDPGESVPSVSCTPPLWIFSTGLYPTSFGDSRASFDIFDFSKITVLPKDWQRQGRCRKIPHARQAFREASPLEVWFVLERFFGGGSWLWPIHQIWSIAPT